MVGWLVRVGSGLGVCCWLGPFVRLSVRSGLGWVGSLQLLRREGGSLVRWGGLRGSPSLAVDGLNGWFVFVGLVGSRISSKPGCAEVVVVCATTSRRRRRRLRARLARAAGAFLRHEHHRKGKGWCLNHKRVCVASPSSCVQARSHVLACAPGQKTGRPG